MAGIGLQALEAELRASAPHAIKQLSDGQLRDLAGAIQDARRRQAAELTRRREGARACPEAAASTGTQGAAVSEALR